MSVTSHLNEDIKKPDTLADGDLPESFDLSHAIPSRPPMVYSSPTEFAKSFARRWKSIWTRRFALALISGQGVVVCIAGLGLLVASDQITDKDWTALSRAKGDGFMIAGATLYGFTNATEEFFVRKRPLYEVVGQLGLYGTLINGIQAAGLEHGAMKLASWNGMTIGLLVAYTSGMSFLIPPTHEIHVASAMFILYTVAPMLYRLASSTYYNLSLLSSDFWGLLFGLFLYHYHPYWLYFIAFAIIIVGLVTYFWNATPEEQGSLNPVAPSYVNKRGAEPLPPDLPSMA
ncbi:hypothetical protein H0H87_008397 [Tephrocybe sp. NHM501043]|nr:hypothetical protein H0H87_008397 [Tephrocybe sp. NHM501043]